MTSLGGTVACVVRARMQHMECTPTQNTCTMA
jgi:hypothetical protein